MFHVTSPLYIGRRTRNAGTYPEPFARCDQFTQVKSDENKIIACESDAQIKLLHWQKVLMGRSARFMPMPDALIPHQNQTHGISVQTELPTSDKFTQVDMEIVEKHREKTKRARKARRKYSKRKSSSSWQRA